MGHCEPGIGNARMDLEAREDHDETLQNENERESRSRNVPANCARQDPESD